MLSLSFWLLLWGTTTTLANTEIVNFQANEEPDAITLPLATPSWPILSPKNQIHGGRWTLQPAPVTSILHAVCEQPDGGREEEAFPCPHELWLTLDLAHADWARHNTFTLRLSWPASYPAEFSVEVYNPRTLPHARLHGSPLPSGSPADPHSTIATTRRKYARIRLVDTGILTPTSGLNTNTNTTRPVPFNLILEPLLLGILPASVLPVLLFNLPILLLSAGLAVPRIIAYLERLADSARQEIAARQKEE